MQGVHELADLAPRDVVAKAITRRMIETGHPHMWLDARHLGTRRSGSSRFPTILATCRRHGVDPVTELIPVAPACHYASGGVRDRPVGPLHPARASTPPARSPAPACTAPTGWPPTPCSRAWCSPAGSPRCCPAELRDWADPAADPRPTGLVDGGVRRALQEEMTARVGVLRSRRRAARGPRPRWTRWPRRRRRPSTRTPGRPPTCSRSAPLLAEAALLREETRGSHWREDFPERDDADQSGHHDWWLRGRRAERRLPARRPRPTPCPTRCPHEPSTSYDDLLERAARGRARPRRGARRHRRGPRGGPARRRRRRHQRGHDPRGRPRRAASSRRASRASSPASASPPWSSSASTARSRSPTGSPDGSPRRRRATW